eukprot:1750258-Alexandrium_andersonii.AAC.1
MGFGLWAMKCPRNTLTRYTLNVWRSCWNRKCFGIKLELGCSSTIIKFRACAKCHSNMTLDTMQFAMRTVAESNPSGLGAAGRRAVSTAAARTTTL